MQIRKQYACDYCEDEFDIPEECLAHEQQCIRNPIKKKCASCCHSSKVTSYEVDFFICKRLLNEDYGCDNWK